VTGATIYGDERAFTEERGARREAPRAPECERSRALEVARATRSEEQSPPTGGALDTLAQLGQGQSHCTEVETKSKKSAALLKRARAKYFSTPLAINLAQLRSPLEKSYRNTVYCSATLTQANGKIVGSYCGNRWCMVCNRIRTARAMRRYMPIVESWPDKYLVTLTLKNVSASELPKRLDLMVKSFQATKLAMRRTDRRKLVALRKLECTYNARTDEYHPHFHVVVAGADAARLLVLRWLERHPEEADIKGQDVRPCDNGTLREMFKYFTKLVAKTRMVSINALDVTFQSIKGHRVYQPIGFAVAAEIPDESAEQIAPVEATDAPKRRNDRVFWEWCQGVTDWVDLDTGVCLTGYEPDEKFRQLVEQGSCGSGISASPG
jgi:hypothetical protein